jgi:hypothetical protein
MQIEEPTGQRKKPFGIKRETNMVNYRYELSYCARVSSFPSLGIQAGHVPGQPALAPEIAEASRR